MPELPEVETIRAGLAPLITGLVIDKITIYETRMRWPVDPIICQTFQAQKIHAVLRRGKYLIITTTNNKHLIIHFGMSGSLRILNQTTPRIKHDHMDICLNNGTLLRYNDPRRFGAILWSPLAPEQHPRLRHIGPEPLETSFNGKSLQQSLQKSRRMIKNAIMDNHVVTGVGNIYASESLFLAKIHPQTPCHTLSQDQYQALSIAIQQTLIAAIQAGGTTLKDFQSAKGKPGYFQQQLAVYNQADQPCTQCQTPITTCIIANRQSYYCPNCQILPNKNHCT